MKNERKEREAGRRHKKTKNLGGQEKTSNREEEGETNAGRGATRRREGWARGEK